MDSTTATASAPCPVPDAFSSRNPLLHAAIRELQRLTPRDLAAVLATQSDVPWIKGLASRILRGETPANDEWQRAGIYRFKQEVSGKGPLGGTLAIALRLRSQDGKAHALVAISLKDFDGGLRISQWPIKPDAELERLLPAQRRVAD